MIFLAFSPMLSTVMFGVWFPAPAAYAAAPAASGPTASGAWEFSGRAGVEVDGLGETFGSGDFSTRLPPSGTPGDPIDVATETLRFRDESTRASALLDLRLDKRGARWLRARSLVRSGRTRTRGDVELAGGLDTSLGAFSLGNRLYFQGGPEGTGSGAQDLLTATWSRRNLPGRFGLRLAASGERSWSGDDSLRSLFDYRVLRNSLEVSRSAGWSGELALRGGVGRKWASGDAPRSWRESWGEAEWTRYFGIRHRWGVRARSEGRRYPRSALQIPSYHEGMVEANAEASLARFIGVRFTPVLRRVDYAFGDSLLYRDHRMAEATLRFESSLAALRGIPLEDRALADWTFHVGGRGGLLRHETARDADHRTASLLAGVSRDGSPDVWLDLTAEAGRRAYRVSGGSGGYEFEGLRLSFSGTDYRFVSTSLVAQTSLGRGVRLDLFGMFDREYHDKKADDFTLWSFTAALTRAF